MFTPFAFYFCTTWIDLVKDLRVNFTRLLQREYPVRRCHVAPLPYKQGVRRQSRMSIMLVMHMQMLYVVIPATF